MWKLKTFVISVPNPKGKSARILIRKKRLCTAIAFFVVPFAFFYFCDLPDTNELGSLVICPFKKESTRLPLASSVNNGDVVYGGQCPDLVYGTYCVLSLASEAERSNTNLGSVTLCTQATVEFLHHVAVLCQRWGGPISVAVYSPPLDYTDAWTLVDTLQRCDFCIRHWVSWHFFGKQEPDDRSIFAGLPDTLTDIVPRDCSAIPRSNWTAKQKSEDPYPINVGRNVARNRAQTQYIFSVDVELYPSTGVLPKFERMIRSMENGASGDPQVWVLPVFEIHIGYPVPRTKFQLNQMYVKRQVVSFHQYKCSVCHMIPNLRAWLEHESQLKSEVNESFEALQVWMTVKRSTKELLNEWEPFFIGTKGDPEFDIRLSWEGKQNKKQMAYEMCLRNYDFNIVDNAFLVHAPGIKVKVRSAEYREWSIYRQENEEWMSLIKNDLKNTYGSNMDC